MPVYNGERHLQACLDGMAAQTRPADEIIISYDRSSDATLAMIEAFAAADPNVRVVHNPGPGGIFPNLNNALRQASGDYLQIFCQDDVMGPDHLARLAHNLDALKEPVAFAFCRKSSIDASGAPLERPKPYAQLKTGIINPYTAYSMFACMGCMPGNLSPVAVNRKAAESVGWFDESLKMLGDFDMWLRLLRVGPMLFIDESLLLQRVHTQRASDVLGATNVNISEDYRVFRMIDRDSPEPEFDGRIVRRIRQWQHVSRAARAVLNGDLRSAKIIIREISRQGELIPSLSSSVLSAMGRRRAKWILDRQEALIDAANEHSSRGRV